MMDQRQVQRWLSAERFAPFLAAADGNHNQAVALYHWHLELSATVFSMIHGLEVVLRNAIDRCLGEGQPQLPLSATWLMDFAVL